jgi:hypothetical protein
MAQILADIASGLSPLHSMNQLFKQQAHSIVTRNVNLLIQTWRHTWRRNTSTSHNPKFRREYY